MHPCTSDWRATTCVLGQCSQVVWVSKIGGFIIPTRSWLYAEWCSCIIFLPDGRARAGYDDFDIREHSFCVLLDSFRLCPIQGKERIAQCKNVSAIFALHCCYNGTLFGRNVGKWGPGCLEVLFRNIMNTEEVSQCNHTFKAVSFLFCSICIFCGEHFQDANLMRILQMYKKCLRIWDQTCTSGLEPWPNILTNCYNTLDKIKKTKWDSQLPTSKSWIIWRHSP